jgi:hypothetical protein
MPTLELVNRLYNPPAASLAGDPTRYPPRTRTRAGPPRGRTIRKEVPRRVRTFLVFIAMALTIAPQAFAKGPISLCGIGGCARVGTVETLPVRSLGEDAIHVAPVAPVPFFKLQLDGISGLIGYWIPSGSVLRLSQTQGGPAVWLKPSLDEVAALTQAAETLRPFLAPTRATVAVNNTIVRHSSTYLRLFTIGTPVATWRGANGWLPIYIWGSDTPWTDGLNFMSISRAGSFLKRSDGDVVKIPARVADRIRHRLPLTG